MFLMYQPIISSDDHSIIGAEALIRWVHPNL
ncbi:EAL domain-containing protein [Vibrio sp. S12_S33]|nr:EAL domain-containing protein [Vibrio sp. S12_S33]